MNHDQILDGFGDEDVITIINSNTRTKTFCTSEFREIMATAKGAMKNAYAQVLISQGDHLHTGYDGIKHTYDGWFDDSGAESRLLRLGDSQWQHGKVRIRVEIEFIPNNEEDSDEVDEPSLDTFREN
jgi:hypothetical protein